MLFGFDLFLDGKRILSWLHHCCGDFLQRVQDTNSKEQTEKIPRIQAAEILPIARFTIIPQIPFLASKNITSVLINDSKRTIPSGISDDY